VLITVDPATGRVLSAGAQNVPVNRSRTAEQDIADYPSVLSPINDTVNAALANAAQVGGTAVGSITGPITTAYSGGSYVNGHYTGGVRDDRASESTLGDLVANALRDGPTSTAPHADLGLVSPQSLRAELAAGAVTYDEANNVLPFTSNVWTVQLTGAQLWQVLEEQWPPGDGAPPSPALGLSDNVRVTADPSHPQGSRITSVRIDGHPLDPAKTYLVSTFSYMVNGGSFPALGQGKSSSFGLIDRDIWFRYLSTHPGLSPDFDRHQVTEHGMPQGSVKAGKKVRFTLGNLNLTSQGSPANKHVNVYLNAPDGTRRVGSFPVHAASGGSATIAFRAPAKLSAPSTLTAVAEPSNTLIGASPGSTVAIKKLRMVHGHRHQVKVVVGSPLRGVPATGRVTLRLKGKRLASHRLRHGRALFAIPRTLKPGRYPLRAKYAGDATHAAAVGRAKLKVKKAKPRLAVTQTPRPVSVGHRVSVGVRLSASGGTVRGKVQVVSAGHAYRARLRHGRAAIKLPAFHSPGRKKVVVAYLGNRLDQRVRHLEHLRVT
jgi:5'-nucleotidase